MCFVLLLYISFAEPIPFRVFAVGGLLVKFIFGGCGGSHRRCEPPKITPLCGAVSIRYTCVGFTRGRSVCIIAVLPIGAVRRRLLVADCNSLCARVRPPLSANSIRIFRDHPVVPHPFGGMAGCLFIKQALRLLLSGGSLRRARTSETSCGPPLGRGCGPRGSKNRISPPCYIFISRNAAASSSRSSKWRFSRPTIW